jgi:hypothetical protein
MVMPSWERKWYTQRLIELKEEQKQQSINKK